MGADETKNVFKQIISDHWDEFQGKHPRYATEYYDGVIEKMLGCGDAANGYVAYRCLSCGELKRVGFSCQSSFCLFCAKVYTDEWVDYIGRMVQHILPKGFQRIRYYGLHATCRASKVRERFKDILLDGGREVVGAYRVTGSVYRERMKRSFGIDPLMCPRCG